MLSLRPKAGLRKSADRRSSLGVRRSYLEEPRERGTLNGGYAGGEHDYDHALLGVQFYIGPAKSLKLRHREDDPPSLMPEILYRVGLYGAECGKQAREHVEEHPDLAGGGSYGIGGSYGVCVTMYGPERPMTPEEW